MSLRVVIVIFSCFTLILAKNWPILARFALQLTVFNQFLPITALESRQFPCCLGHFLAIYKVFKRSFTGNFRSESLLCSKFHIYTVPFM